MNLKRLRGEIVAEHKTQNAFAEAIGWHRNKVSALLNGRYIPDVNEAATIASDLNLSTELFSEIFLHSATPNGDGRESA